MWLEHRKWKIFRNNKQGILFRTEVWWQMCILSSEALKQLNTYYGVFTRRGSLLCAHHVSMATAPTWGGGRTN